MSLTLAPVRRGRRFVWQTSPRSPADDLRALGDDLHPLLSQLLGNRGIIEPETARRFLNPEREPLADPHLMAGMAAALARLSHAIASDELIAVYGDYDVDGLTATAVLCVALGRLGARALPFIPHREKDGYGLQDGPLADLRAAGASLVITVDCGVTANREIANARAAGLDFVVTDHHPVPPELPAAVVLNPNRTDCAYPFKELAGVGVAYKLAQAIVRKHLSAAEAEPLLDDLLELVAIGTLADVVGLRGENRTIVRRGLARLNATHRPGLAALTKAAGLQPGSIDADRVCFALAPRLNAAGRLEHARIALDLLLAESAEAADPIAARLDELNCSRQTMLSEALELVRTELKDRELGAGIVVSGEFPVGIVGLIAGKLAEEHNRPAIVLSRAGEKSTGSARSVAGVNVVDAMRAGAEYLERFGGHAMAAGLTLRSEHLSDFERAFAQAVADARGPFIPDASLRIDAQLRPETAAAWATLELLPRLEPCGAGNPRPLFLTLDLLVADLREVGKGCQKLKLAGSKAPLTALVFGNSEAPPLGARVDVVYHLKRSLWQGTIAPELELVDWRETSGTSQAS